MVADRTNPILDSKIVGINVFRLWLGFILFLCLHPFNVLSVDSVEPTLPGLVCLLAPASLDRCWLTALIADLPP